MQTAPHQSAMLRLRPFSDQMVTYLTLNFTKKYKNNNVHNAWWPVCGSNKKYHACQYLLSCTTLGGLHPLNVLNGQTLDNSDIDLMSTNGKSYTSFRLVPLLMTLKDIWRLFSLGCHFHVHFRYPWHAFASHGLPAIAELLVLMGSARLACKCCRTLLWVLP